MELRFKIKEIPSDGTPQQVRRPIPRELLATVLEGTDGDVDHAAVDLDVQLMRERDDVIARGRLKGSLEVPCGRCVEPAKVPIDAKLDALFAREVHDVQTDHGLDPEDAEDLLDAPDTYQHDGMHIELADVVRDMLIAELPIAPLCSQRCKGLCTTCGANQNTEPCGHAQAAPDVVTRRGLAALADFKLPS